MGGSTRRWVCPAPPAAGRDRREGEQRGCAQCFVHSKCHPSLRASVLLRARRERPRRRRAAEQLYELAPRHSITSAAAAISVGGTVRPSTLAVLRLITSSYLVGCWTGNSAGFAPLRMRST